MSQDEFRPRNRTDKLRPTNATAEGQMLDLAEGLGSAGRRGKVLAYVILLAMLALGVWIAFMVATASA